jgi:hypothetical protein
MTTFWIVSVLQCFRCMISTRERLRTYTKLLEYQNREMLSDDLHVPTSGNPVAILILV